jgi:hypothetical protein
VLNEPTNERYEQANALDQHAQWIVSWNASITDWRACTRPRFALLRLSTKSALNGRSTSRLRLVSQTEMRGILDTYASDFLRTLTY